MSAIAYRSAESFTQRQPRFWTRLRRVFGAGGCALDVESLPEHLKRDLGLMGGRAAPPRDIFRD